VPSPHFCPISPDCRPIIEVNEEYKDEEYKDGEYKDEFH
jgi:hypothetical protein